MRVNASLLREGRTATIVEVGSPAGGTSLRPGMTIMAGPRREGDAVWTLRLPDGQEVQLDHAAADAVTVILEDGSPATDQPHPT
jgi:hypothetical protein